MTISAVEPAHLSLFLKHKVKLHVFIDICIGNRENEFRWGGGLKLWDKKSRGNSNEQIMSDPVIIHPYLTLQNENFLTFLFHQCHVTYNILLNNFNNMDTIIR